MVVIAWCQVPGGDALAAVPADAVLGQFPAPERVAGRAPRYAITMINQAGAPVALAAPAGAVHVGAVRAVGGDVAGVAAVPAFQGHRRSRFRVRALRSVPCLTTGVSNPWSQPCTGRS